MSEIPPVPPAMSIDEIPRPGRPGARFGPVALPLLAGALLLALALLFLLFHVPRERARVLAQLEGDLEHRADTRALAVDQWSRDRLNDLTLLASDTAVREALASRVRRRARGVRLDSALASTAAIEEFLSLRVVGPRLQVVAAGGEPGGLGPADSALARGVLAGSPRAVAVARGRGGRIEVLFARPVPGGPGPAAGVVLGAVSAEEWFYPLMRASFGGLSSVEAILAERDGPWLRFLTPLRFSRAAPLTFRVPFHASRLAARYAIEGRAGFGEYLDYRGVPVFAVVRRLHPVPWGLVVKVDRREVMGAFARRMNQEALGLGGVLVLALALLLAWRAKASLEQRRQRELLQAIMDVNPVMIFTKGRDERYLLANRAYAALLGRTVEEVVGRTPTELGVSAEQARELHRADLEVLETGREVFVPEVAVDDPSGARHILQMTKRPLHSNHGRTVLGVATDITARKELEDRLAQARKLEALGALAAGVAHDFNNLLQGVLGHAELARARLQPGSPALENLDRVTNAAREGARLTSQLLAYVGRSGTRKHELDLSLAVEGAVAPILASLSGRIALRKELAGDLPPVPADPGEIEQVVTDLVRNAAEAIGDGPGTIAVRTRLRRVAVPAPSALPGTEIRPGDYAVLEVCDSGSGMNEEVLRRIFDPFFSTKFLGRGLGLAAVGGVVRNHAGAVEVESAPGRGSCFRVFFPLDETNGRGGAGTPGPRGLTSRPA